MTTVIVILGNKIFFYFYRGCKVDSDAINVDGFSFNYPYDSYAIAYLYNLIKDRKIEIEPEYVKNDFTVIIPRKFEITISHHLQLLSKINIYYHHVNNIIYLMERKVFQFHFMDSIL